MTFEEFRYGVANSAAKSKSNGHSGRRVLHKMGLKIGIGGTAGANVDKANSGSFAANYADDSTASLVLPDSSGFGYTGHRQNDGVPVALYRKGTHGPKDAAVAQPLKSSAYSHENFTISQAGSYCTPNHNIGFDHSAAVRSEHVKRHAR